MVALWIILTAAIAVLFFAIRCRKPVLYGAGEIAVGLVGAYFVYLPATSNLILSQQDPLLITFSKSVAWLAAAYIIVRGLDNIDRGLTKNRRSWWDAIFKGAAHPSRIHISWPKIRRIRRRRDRRSRFPAGRKS